ncbi:MAG: RNA-binding protein [Candidatus Woesebacteria bacterium]|jgi:RNA recognition motif-containing protein
MFSPSDTAQQNKSKLFVGNLPFSLGEDELTNMFSEYGELASVKLIIDRATGRSRGFAFVEFKEEKDAKAAEEASNGMEVEGRELIVNIARPQAPRDSRGPRGPRRDFRPRRDNYSR